MVSKVGYDSGVERLNSATVAVLALVLGGVVFLSSAAQAQINGTPASVTSINSGGHLNSTPGAPASITSLGPNSLQPRSPFFTQPPCCINPLFPSNPAVGQRHHHHRSGQFFPGNGAVYVPYAYPVVASEPETAYPDDQQAEDQREDEYQGGPTIFDRRGPGQAVRPFAEGYPEPPRHSQAEPEAAPEAQPETPVPDQPQSVLVFKDGHQLEVQNYAVIGDTLYDLTPGRHHKIPLADLDLAATAQQNDERGIDFRLPPKPEMSK
ncbi:MAG: hypothetical protein ACRD20_14440 [Terriglobales bacterium]